MANGYYAKGANKVLAPLIGGAALTGTLKVALVADTYTADLTNHEFYTSIAAHVLGAPIALAGGVVANGALDGDDPVFPDVPSGDKAAAMVLFMETGNPATSSLIAYIDQIGGFPYLTNGLDVEPRWDNGPHKILALV